MANPNNSLWAITPDLKTPYVQQWSFGYEREIAKDTAFEIRYAANHAVKLYRAVDFNEINIFENGFLTDFRNAQNNLAICQANSVACRAAQASAGIPATIGSLPSGTLVQTANTFQNWGLPGQVALNSFPRFFNFTNLITPTSSSALTAHQHFANANFVNNLNNNNIGTLAATLAFSNIYRSTRELASNGIPANFFVANPNASGARLLTNDSMSNYHSLQVEIRKRFSDGLQFQADYTFSKALTDAPDAQGNNQNTLENFRTFRNKRLDYRRSNDDQTHRFVANGIYDLPFGNGRRWLSGSNGFVNQAIGGWSLGGIVVWATRPPFFVTSGRTTFNAWGAGTEANNLPAQLLGGMSFEEFKQNVGVFRTPGGVFWFNPEHLDVTLNAAGRVVSSTLKPGILGPPQPGTFGDFPMNSINSGRYFNTDVSVTKRFPIRESVSFDIKTTFINIFNNPNFTFGNVQFDSTSFGRITTTAAGNPRVIHFMGTLRF